MNPETIKALEDAGFQIGDYSDREGAIAITHLLHAGGFSAEWIRTGHVVIESHNPTQDVWARIEAFARVMKEATP